MNSAAQGCNESIDARECIIEELTRSERGDGNQRISKVTAGDHTYVVKQYGLKRSWIRAVLRSISHATYAGKSGVSARARLQTERETLQLWAREGIDVPAILPENLVPDSISGLVLVLEWVGGLSLREVLHCTETPLARKRELLARFARTCAYRHDRALALRDPRLIFEHPTFAHVLVDGERLSHIDFEMVFTRAGRIEASMQREIVSFLRTLSKLRDNFDELFRCFIEAYPDRQRLLDLVVGMRRRKTALMDGFGRSGPRVGIGKRDTVDRIEAVLADLDAGSLSQR